MTFQAAAAATGLYGNSLRYHDDELQPERTAAGERLYDASVVARFVARRATSVARRSR
jgi:hypothetical protein